MADVVNLSQTANDGDRLAAAWINNARSAIAGLQNQVDSANLQIDSLKSQLSQAFRVTVLSGLTVSYAGGLVKLPSGLIASIASASLAIANNTTSYLYVDENGQVLTSTTRPDIGLEIARIVASSGQITQIQNYPLFEVRPTLPDLSLYATIDYTNGRSWQNINTAQKTTTQAIASRDTYYTITWQSITGTPGFNTAGTFTAPVNGNYIFHCQVRVDTLAPDVPLAVKLSLFDSNSETGLPLAQGDSAYGDITLNASNAFPLQLEQGEDAYIKIYLTRGISSRVRENSRCQIWKVP